MRKIYIVPNFLTTLNMFCGFYSVVASIRGEFVVAAWAIIVATIFDMLDGRVARLAKATSHFGVEYDSLSDLISFGLAPAMLLYLWLLEPYGRMGWLASFLFLACGALRLARFNVHSGSYTKAFFLGVPIPVAAGFVATFTIFQDELGMPSEATSQTLGLVMALGLGSLMVSTIPFPSFKELNWKSRASFGYLLVGVLLLILVAVKPEVTLFSVACAYLCVSLAWNALRFFSKENRVRSRKRGQHSPSSSK